MVTSEKGDEPADGIFRTVLLVGPPGSGKGTQGQALGRLPGILFLSMGHLLREIKSDTPLGRAVAPYLRRGDLVPSERIVAAWRQQMASEIAAGFQPERHVLLLDGAPRNIEQAEMLAPQLQVARVIHLTEIEDAVLLERIRSRDGDREDADDAVSRHRLRIYREQTLPMLAYYPPECVAAIDGRQSPLEVLRDITNALTIHRPPLGI